MTDRIHPDQHRIMHPKVNPVLSTAQDRFFQCIWKWRRRKTRRWPKVGRRMLMGSSYLCAPTFQPCASYRLISCRLAYSLLSLHRSSLCRSRTFDRTHKIPLTSTLPTYIRLLSPTQIDPITRVPSLPPHPSSLHPRTLSGSTRFGS